MILNYKKWRGILAHYCVANGLAHAGSIPEEKGWSSTSRKPFGRPARHVLQRVLDHLVADKKLKAKYNNGTLNSHVRKVLLPPKPKETMGGGILRSALHEVGVHEDPWGSNRGWRVEWYQAATGAFGAAWCASFVSKMARINGYKGRVSAGAWNLTDTCGKRVAGIKYAKPGDAVSLNIGEGHVGILEYVDWARGLAFLVAGNTSNSVKVEGYPISLIHSICRLEN